MELKNKLQTISKENEEKENELSSDVFETLVGAAEKGRYDVIVQLSNKDINILEKQGFEVYKFNHNGFYFVSWEDNNEK